MFVMLLLAILEALRTLDPPLAAVPVPAQRAPQVNIFPEVPAQHALPALIKLPQVRHHVLCALQASMELRQDSLLKLPLVSL